MAEYIKRSEAIEAFDNPAVERYYGDVSPESVIRVIEQIPAANVRPVVLCWDCKHYQGVHHCQGHAPCDYWGIGGVLWNDFCSRGAKMEES